MFCSTLFVVTKGDLIAKLGENPAKGQTFRVFSLPAATPLLYGVTVIQGWRPHCQCGIYLVLTAHWHIQGADTLFPKKGSQLPNLSCAKAPRKWKSTAAKDPWKLCKDDSGFQDQQIKWYSWARFERCWCLSTLINTHIINIKTLWACAASWGPSPVASSFLYLVSQRLETSFQRQLRFSCQLQLKDASCIESLGCY